MTLLEPVHSNVHAESDRDIEQVTDYPVFNEGRYTGTVLRETKVPHGHGRFEYNSEDEALFYDGEFKHGHYHGYGCLTFRSGDNYIGQFLFDQREGQGLYQWDDGRVDEGEFREDKRHGKVRNNAATS